MKRLLCIVPEMNVGGSETFLMKMFRKLDKTKFQMDFVEYTGEKAFYDDEIIQLGGNIYHLHPKSQGFRKNYKEVFELVKSKQYKYVLRSTTNAAGVWELVAAKKAGATKLILKSTNSKTTKETTKEKIIHALFKPLAKKIPNVKIAPSELASNFVFGKNSLKHGARLFHNAIDLDSFSYSEANRAEIRKQMNIQGNNLVVGHIGRFNEQKNHLFLLEIFKEIAKQRNDSKLVLVGDGPLKQKIETICANDPVLSEKVIFAGIRKDVEKVLSAFDLFLFPSLFEGLPNTVIEAQATGIPCLISDTITNEVMISSNIKSLNLSKSPNIWAKTAIEMAGTINLNASIQLKRAGYDINDEIQNLTNLIFAEE